MDKEIKKDFYNISKRIKEIGQDFYIVFNRSLDKFQIKRKSDLRFIVTIPYDELDERTLNYVKIHLKKTNDEIIEEIEKTNALKSKLVNEKIKQVAIEKAEKVLRRS